MPASGHERSPEQLAQIQRLGPPIAISSLVMGIAGLIILLRGTSDIHHPPSIWGVNLSFCAMLMGIGIILWAKGSGVIRWALWMSTAAVLLGAVGPFLFFKSGVDVRAQMEQKELANVAAIAKAALTYAVQHNDQLPPTLEVLRDQRLLTTDDLHSPYGSDDVVDKLKLVAEGKLSQSDYEAWHAQESDYSYLAPDLRIIPPFAPSAAATAAAATMTFTSAPAGPEERALILVASAKNPVMRIRLAVAFADGSSRFITMDEAEAALKASNQARAKLGLPMMRPMDPLKRAEEAERRQFTPPQ